jgi:hypothetical protein
MYHSSSGDRTVNCPIVVPSKGSSTGISLDKILLKSSDKPMEPFLAQRIYEAMMDAYLLYGEQEYIDFDELCNEVTFEMELMEHEEEVLQKLNKKIDALYMKLHPSRNLETIPGIGKLTKAGPTSLRRALYIAADVARQ